MPRLWLDATADDPDDVANPPIPEIPERHARDAGTARSTSLPPSKEVRRTKRASKHDSSQPEAPDVISSLVDSLSMLQVPGPDQFRSWSSPPGASLSTPPSPGTLPTAFEGFDTDAGSVYGGAHGAGRSARNSIATMYSTYNHSLYDADFPSADDAAEPPVVRTSKPPSGFSPLTAPKSPRKETGMRGLMKSASRSATSLASFRGDDDARSIGNISIEPGTSTLSPPNERRGSGAGTGTRVRSLIYMGSRERLWVKDRDWVRRPSRDSILSASDEAAIAAKQMQAPPSIREEWEDREGLKIPGSLEGKKKRRSGLQVDVSKSALSPRLGQSKLEYTDSGSPSVPLRRSSLRHSDGPGQRKLKIQSRRSSRQLPQKTEPVPEEPSKAEQQLDKDTRLDDAAEPGSTENNDLDGVDTQVTKRIKELKAQKVIRDREARLSADTTMLGLGLDDDPGHRTSGDISNPPSNDSQRSSASSWTPVDAHAGDGKAHRVLGTRAPSSASADSDAGPPELPAHSLPPEMIPTRSYVTVSQPHTHTVTQYAVRNTGTANSDKRPPTPITPMDVPINYNFVVRSLDKVSTKSTHSSKSSIRNSITATVTRPLSISGRSRRGASKSAAEIPHPSKTSDRKSSTDAPDWKSSTGVPDQANNPLNVSRKPSTNTTSTTITPTTQSSKPVALQPPPPRRPSKPQRWSHPDLPLRMDGTHTARNNSKGSKATNAANSTARAPSKHRTKTDPLPVPPSADSDVDDIDLAVDRFLSAPRLSRKVKHPVSGRIICFSDVGDPDGHAVFCCVGMGLTRYVAAFYDELARTLKLRIITLDRPGVGESEGDAYATPLNWPDDVSAVCATLKITKFSMLAHSAGAIYALATALRMPQHIRGRVHLLAPWIPPSQMSPAAGIAPGNQSPGQLPKAQRFLRVLPTPLLRVANSSLMSATSASVTRNSTKPPKGASKRRSAGASSGLAAGARAVSTSGGDGSDRATRPGHTRSESILLMDQQMLRNASTLSVGRPPATAPSSGPAPPHAPQLGAADWPEYDARLTAAIWARATQRAQPVLDLLVCLERHQPIGFRYVDITRPVVIHHGSKDTRVPVENARWLGRTMRRCEVRVLEGEAHGLMGSAGVMSRVLTEVAGEWEDWNRVIREGGIGEGV